MSVCQPLTDNQKGKRDPRITLMKCKRKQSLINKCNALASLCDLKIALVIVDEHVNSIEEFKTSSDMSIQQIAKMLIER